MTTSEIDSICSDKTGKRAFGKSGVNTSKPLFSNSFFAHGNQ
ncbi:MAG: hypothetical protein ACPHY8_06420 [Patescibacteria group bacterium]